MKLLQIVGLVALASLAACAPKSSDLDAYALKQIVVAIEEPEQPDLDAAALKREGEVPPPQTIMIASDIPVGTILISTAERQLAFVASPEEMILYPIAVGRDGMKWSGESQIIAKRQWPDWHPPQEMREREAMNGHFLPEKMEGGLYNPLGARALYIGESQYRIHGTDKPWSIGTDTSSGCFRMYTAHILDLYDRVPPGAKVIVYNEEQEFAELE